MLLIVGDGPDMHKKPLASPHTRITGFVQNVVPFLQAMDVFVLPSLTETSSLSTMEAMATGIPVIVTPVGHVRGYVENSFNGLLFQKGDVEMLVTHMERLYRDARLRKQLADCGRRTIITKYTREKMIRSIIALLKKNMSKAECI